MRSETRRTAGVRGPAPARNGCAEPACLGWRLPDTVPLMGSGRLKRISAFLAFPLFVAAVATVALVWREPLTELLRSPETLRSRLAGAGIWAPLAFMGLQFIQVVIFVIPGEVVQIAGGFAFGIWGGSLYSSLGILAGSVCNFAVGRALGRPFALAVMGAERFERVERLTLSGKAAAGFFLLFAIPGIPKDALSYVAGASRLSLPGFILISGLGRLPGIVGSSLLGSAVYERDYGFAISLLAAASVLLFLGLFFRERLHALLERLVTLIHRR